MNAPHASLRRPYILIRKAYAGSVPQRTAQPFDRVMRRHLAAATLPVLAALAVAGLSSAADPSRTPLPSPVVSPTTAEAAAWQPLPLYNDAVPVLAYHVIGNSTSDGYTISQQEFALEMEMLHRAGFHTISPAVYDEFLHGKTYDLPTRPILITFDDGRVGSYTGADQVLARYGFQATMFVIAGDVGKPSYLTWDELRQMQASGRWTMQLHAGYGHVLVPTGKGKTGPYYANERLLATGKPETFAQFQARVVQDLNWGERQLKAEIPSFVSNLFAVPYSNYGQDGTNDPRIPGYMKQLLAGRFDAVFLDDRAAWSTPNQAHGIIERFALHSITGADRLYLWLKGLQPHQAPVPPAGTPAPTSLSLNVQPPAASVRAGSRIILSAQVMNTGTADAVLVQLTDRLPAAMTLVRAPAGCTVDETRLLVCQIGTLAAGQTAARTIILKARAAGVAANRLTVADSYRLELGFSDTVTVATRMLGKPRRR